MCMFESVFWLWVQEYNLLFLFISHENWPYKDIMNFAGTQTKLCACVCVSVFRIHYNIALSAKPRINGRIYRSPSNAYVRSETGRFVALMLSKFSFHKE